MKRNYKIIIGVAVGLLVVLLLYRFSKRASNSNVSYAPQQNVSSNIPPAVQRELAYHNEGESLTYQGVKYTVVGGQWVTI